MPREMTFTLSRHAQEEIQRRAIPLALLESVLQHPQQVVPAQGGGRIFLLRAIVADNVDPAIVVTVYRTSKISKY